MRTPARLGLYGAGLALAFAGAFGIAGAVVPQSTVDAWGEPADEGAMDHGDETAGAAPAAVRGLGLEQDGYLLGEIAAPDRTGTEGILSFQITDADGEVLTDYTVAHEQRLHLIVVRTDGAHFRHVHPALDADGTWSIPWSWEAAGAYRVYTDFVPADTDEDLDVTLARTVEVTGDYTAEPLTEPSRTSAVDGFEVALDGELTAGALTELTVTVSRDGEPVTGLQPYLGAFGHLVALRQGDLAYLHVHSEGDEPAEGDLSGPEIAFMTEAPTEGRYLLYLDFQVDGQVHTASFVVEAAAQDERDR